MVESSIGRAEHLQPTAGHVLITDDVSIRVPGSIDLGPGDTLTLPLLTSRLSAASRVVAESHNSEFNLRSKWAHLSIDVELRRYMQHMYQDNQLRGLMKAKQLISYTSPLKRGDDFISVTNYGASTKILEGEIPFGRFMSRGTPLMGDDLIEAAGRIQLKDENIGFVGHDQETAILVPLTHYYEQLTPPNNLLRLQDFEGITPRNRQFLIDHYHLSPVPLTPEGRNENTMIIASTPHMTLPDDIALVVLGGVGADGRVFHHGSAPFIDPGSDWPINIEVRENGDQFPHAMIAQVYFTQYV